MDISAIFGLLDSFFAVAENVGVPKEISQFIVFTLLLLAIAIYVWQKIYHWIPKRSLLEPPAQTPQPTENIDFSRLPKLATVELIGRGGELKKLTTALKNKDKRLVYIQAIGGVGKSALISKWLKDMQPDYHGASKVFAWSFYSQGSHDTQNSSIPFFQAALPFFGYSGELPKDDIAKGRALAKCLQNQSFILILDGLEPLQHPTHILDGELKDVALKALFTDIEYHGLNQSPSLIVVSSRQPLVELPSWADKNYQTIDLQTLLNGNGAKLLRKLGVIGTDKELRQATQEMGGHALALVLLGKMLVAQFNSDIARRDQLPMLQTALESLESSQALREEDEKLYRQVRRVLQWYADFYTENNTPEAIFLNLLSLFDRPLGLAEKDELIKKADCAAPLRDLNSTEWQQLEKTLENAGLLLPHEGMRTEWDCHPLIRSYFAQQFKETHPDLFRQAHLVLFEYYQEVPKKEPDTLEELKPLYRAVVHGCLAGEYQKALELYQQRIQQGVKHYGWHKFTGAYSQDLATLTAFFPEGWSQQPIQQGLQKLDIAWLLTTISYCLKSVGRVAESIEPREKSIEIFVRLSRWTDASTSSQNLVEAFLILGNLAKSLQIAQQAIEYADRGENLESMNRDYLGSRAYLATVLHRQGQLAEAAAIFKEIRKTPPNLETNYEVYPMILHLIIEFWYCGLMLDQNRTQLEIEGILEHGEKNLEASLKIGMLLYISLNQLIIARSYSKLHNSQKAESYFNQSVASIGKTERREHLPMFLIDRANFYLDQQQVAEAKHDLTKAWLIIKRSDMKLYAVDYHLAMRRAEPEEAQFHETEAKKLIAATGYHLRDKNV